MNKIITISREFGSGGREIGRRLAEAMKIAYYDQEIVAALIKRTKKAEEYVHYMEKERPLPLLPITTARTFGLPTNYAVTENLNFYMQESKIIQEVAEKSDCVIVGRCADYVLRDMKPIRLFIYADMEYKIVRCTLTQNCLWHGARILKRRTAKSSAPASPPAITMPLSSVIRSLSASRFLLSGKSVLFRIRLRKRSWLSTS